MTGRSFAVSLVVVAVVFGIGGRCTAPDPAPLPAKTQARITRTIVQNAVDSAETKRLIAERDRARRAMQAMHDTAEMVAQEGLRAHRRADTLQAVAIRAQTAADSARAWHAAYDARTDEAAQLRLENTLKDSALAVAAHERMVVDSAYIIMAGHAARSDTLIAELLPLAQRRDPCRIARVLQCPSRTQVAIGSAVTTVVVTAIVSGKIRIRLPF